jgi:hypothetical protein
VIRYGVELPDELTPAQVELWAYANEHSPANGGLGKQEHLKRAMMLLWPHLYAGEAEPGVPRWREDLELLTWAWCNFRIISVIGHASAAKTHTFGHIAAASYLADSLNSIITLTSTHLTGLRKRLWSDTVSAIKTADIGDGLFGAAIFDIRTHDMTIRPAGSKEDKYVIEGIATDRGQDAVEKIQGTHSRRRRYVIIDEAQGTPPAIFEATSNLMTDPDFRIVMLANPTRRFSTFGNWCEPDAGWHTIDPEVDVHWQTKKGGVCIRLDGLRSANIRAGRTIFPFLVRQDYLDSVAKAFGIGSPRWWTFVRGWFAPEGLTGIVYPGSVLHKAEAPIVYQMAPTKCAALDPAFEGGDNCAIVHGEFGDARGSRWALNLTSVDNVKVAVTETSEPLDYLIAHDVMRRCKEVGVLPENFIMDVTGAGRGVAAILEKEWGPIQKCSFGAGVSDRKLRKSDAETSKDLFDRFVSELWWAGRVWMEEGLVGNVGTHFKALREQLSAREYETVKDKKISIETKTDMKARIGYSPDEADAFVQLVELLRRKGATVGSALAAVAGGARDAAHLKHAVRQSAATNPEKEYTHGHD